MSDKPSFFAELKRRHVWRVAIAYAVTAWLLLQLAAIVLPTFGAPHWVLKVLIGVFVLFFPIAIIVAWAFEVTPEGVRRTEAAESEAARAAGHRRHVGRTLNIGIIVVLAAAVGVLLWQRLGTSPTTQVAHVATAATAGAAAPAVGTTIPAKSIAVLPFENLSTDKGNAYFAAGMQDLILTKLADIGDLKVISRTSTMQYGSHPQNLTQIGKELGVATLLEGSVQKAGDQVLVNVQLIDAKTDSHLWAESYTRTLKNVFGVEGEVAEKIASALNAKLSPEESRRLSSGLSDDSAANLLYLRARHEIDAIGSTNPIKRLTQAIDLYRQAVSKVSGFALARAGLSYAESLLASYGGGGEDAGKLRADARAQAEQALKLAPSLPESHLAMGYVEYYGKGHYDAALDAFAAALRLRPNDAAVYAARGYALNRQGKFSQAIEALRKAWSLDPNAREIPFNLGSIYMAQGNYDEAETIFRNAIALQPDNANVRYGYASCIMLSTGNVERSIAEMKGPGDLLGLGRAIFLIDHREYEQAIALVKTLPDSIMSYYPGGKDMELAGLYQSAGDMPRARTYASRALPGLRALLQGQAGHPEQTWRVLSAMATAQLILGKTRDAMESLKAMLAAGEASGDLSERPFVVLEVAQGYAMAGRPVRAVPLLSRALTMPGIGRYYSPVMLWIDPAWDPIRKSPAFQALLKKYATYRPTDIPPESVAPATTGN